MVLIAYSRFTKRSSQNRQIQRFGKHNFHAVTSKNPIERSHRRSLAEIVTHKLSTVAHPGVNSPRIFVGLAVGRLVDKTNIFTVDQQHVEVGQTFVLNPLPHTQYSFHRANSIQDQTCGVNRYFRKSLDSFVATSSETSSDFAMVVCVNATTPRVCLVLCIFGMLDFRCNPVPAADLGNHARIGRLAPLRNHCDSKPAPRCRCIRFG